MKKQVLFIHGGGLGAYEADSLLATSLQDALGPTYDVQHPKMPNEESPEYEAWKAQIATELTALHGEVILVGHSLGGSVLLKYLCDEQAKPPIAGLFLIASPYWGGDENWNYDALTLPENVAARLASIPRLFFYHSHDDETVPFAHLALYATKLPYAIIRMSDGRGHQFGNDLADIAEDMLHG